VRTDVVVRDGVRLAVLRTDIDAQRPTVLFINAVGMAASLCTELLADFQRAGYNAITWELRGSPGPTPEVGDSTLAEHARDGRHILDALGVTRTHVLGWCTGASIALFLADLLGDRLSRLVATDGAYLFDGFPGGPLGNAMYAMCGDIVANVDTATRYHELTQPRGNEATVLGLEGLPALVDHMTLPYRQGLEDLVRYAFAIRNACDYDPVSRWSKISCPTLITARRDDRMVSWRNSVRAAELVPSARTSIAETGGHYGLFTDPATVPDIAAFLAAG
jgi:pimeloyl-ACP methyl ester carboxylesterase